MDSKKDIYNLWIQYTTKNEESFFREFVERFVLIWKSELPVDFASSECPFWHEVQADNGPHLGRMPDELLPAIGKFIIVARDKSDTEVLSEEEIKQVSILVDCLLIICRNFENILSVIKYEYKSNLIAILANCFKHQQSTETKVTPSLILLYQSFSLFLEAMYDPYLTWRSFLRNALADFSKLSYKPHAVHVEIIPFIYDCFMDNNMTKYPELGESLLHILGSVISGSQRNGMRAICPATVSIIMKVASDWESSSKLREPALKCFAMMVIVLQKSSPEERQIDLVTLIQLYCDVLRKLLDTQCFSNNNETFQIASNSDDNDVVLDVNALSETIANIRSFLSDPHTAPEIEEAIENTNLIDALIDVPKNIKNWNINVVGVLSSTMTSLAKIISHSPELAEQMIIYKKTQRLFDYLKAFGPPTEQFLDACFSLAFNDDLNTFTLPDVMIELINWTPEMNERQQNHISNSILKACTSSYSTKLIACQNYIISAVTLCLKRHKLLSEQCIQNFIKLIEEISKLSITAVELKNIFSLLCLEEEFPQSNQLLQTLVIISLQSLSNSNICSQYLSIKDVDDGIIVNDIKNWTMSGSYGFIFHALLRFEPWSKTKTDDNETGNGNKRRMLLNMRTINGTGFEIFFQESGNIVVATLTQREYLTSSVSTSSLIDGQWHYVTIAVTPPKRPFSYSQINIFVDFMQKLSTTLKVQGINEPFTFCSVGSANNPIKPSDAASVKTLTKASSQQTATPSRGMLPNLLERTLSTNVKNYFTLPLRSQTSFGPNVKNFPLGMEETVFGRQVCMNGDIGAILLAEPTTNLKTIFDTGPNFASIFSQDNDIIELTSRFVFCYAPGAFWKGCCHDLIPGGKFKGQVQGHHSRIIKIHDAINSVGGIQAILPILHKLKHQDIDLSLLNKDQDNESSNNGGGSGADNDDTMKVAMTSTDLSDWEVLPLNSYTELKMIQTPLASFLCFLRYLTHDHDNNKESILNSETFGIIGMMLQKCPPEIFDVNVLMATHLLMESFQGQRSSGANTMEAVLEALYSEIIFNFGIWSRTKFQITLGHVQYLSAIIKNDRKYYRKKFGVQFFLDVIRQYYGCPENINPEDAKTIRSTIFSMIRFYLQKDVNIKEINVIIAFLASVKQHHLLIEFLEIMAFNIKGKKCTDQMILLLHEPKTANLIYNFFVDKTYSQEVQEAAIRFISSLLSTSLVHQKYKMTLRLFSYNSDSSMFPGFFSYTIPMHLSSTIILHLMDEMLGNDADYTGLIFLVSQLSSTDISLKLEVAKRLLQTTFIKPNAAQKLAKQIGWQESIARLLIKKPLTRDIADEEKRKSFGINADVLLEDADFSTQPDLISFSERDNLSLNLQMSNEDQDPNDSVLLLNEIQAGVSEAANVIESEIKELAESVSGAVVENVTTVFSVIRQTTHDIQDTFESLTLGSSTESFQPSSPRLESESSEGSLTSPPTSSKKGDSLESNSGVELSIDGYENSEEQLVYLVTNILFTILWRGVGNDQPDCWKERCQVLGCINLLALNNDLLVSHLTIRLHILEMAVQAALFDLSEHGHQTLINQENASHILRLVYDLVVLGSNEDESKKCSTKLLDGVMALLDALMIFQHDSADDWCDMIRLCLGLLLKCTHHPNPSIVAMATAKLHGILQSRNTKDPNEMAYLLFTINKALDNAIEVGNPEEYSFLMPVMKALLEKCRNVFNLDLNLPDLPSTLSGPVFFNDFQMYSTSKKWRTFIERIVKPLYEHYQREVELSLWEPINRDWAECYEACKVASKKRAKLQLESRCQFQQKIITPWRMRQIEETARLNAAALQQRTRSRYIEKKWKIIKRFLYGPRGPWFNGQQQEEHWILSSHENSARMRLKLEPQLYPDKHEMAANLRDNATNASDDRQLSEFESTIKNVVVRDFLVDDESQQLEEELRASMDTHPQQDGPLEKSVISQDCELITLMTKVKGRIEVNQNVFSFVDLSPPSLDGSKHDFHFSISKIKEIHLRKYNLRRSALEVFLVDQTSYFLNFTTKTRNKIFTKILSLQPPNILYGSGRSPAELLRASGLTQKWVNREISNFEYLMHLNTIAGRSYNDLSQYPVFPWILADFTSDILDLTDPKSFRDLSKPIGVINPKNEGEVRAKYDSFEDPSGTIPKFHYGTHYSNSAGVLHYLLRVEPFTSLHIDLQSGRFDVADRQFHSIPQTWKLLMDNPNDVKELIPEFFYFPEFLKNMNKLDLGNLQITKEKVDDVILPAWANSPEEFIAIHRRALESEYVSRNLHQWIDLIFGYKQRGPEAVKALNVFYYCCYEGAVDLDKITNPIEREAVEGMINNFGQVPSQLMREAHPCRLSQDEIVLKLLRFELRRPNLTHFLDKVVSYYCELSTSKDPIVFLSRPRSPPKSFLQVSPDVLVSISKSCILGCNSWIPYDKDRGFLLEVDATTTNMKNRKKIFGPFHPSLTPNSEMFAVSADGKLLYAGGIWDNSLRVYNLYKGKVVASVTRHMDIITCLALDNCGSYLVTGSNDCTCIIWSVQNHHFGNVPVNNIPMHALTSQANLQAITQLNTQNSYAPWPLTTLYGHNAPITSVAIHTELDVVVSGSMDGTVNIYTIQEGQFVRTVKPLGCTESCVQISFVTISYHGHIAFSALDDTSHSVHVYSVNGSSLGSKYVSGRVTGLTTASDYLIVADDAGDITMSRLNGLKPIFDIPLHVPIQTVVVTPGNTHLLAPLRDGRLAVVGVHIPIPNSKKHSVLNV